MTLIRTLISDALRESGILALGDTPEAASEDEGLRRLNTLIRSLLGNELGEKFVSYSYGTGSLGNTYSLLSDQQDDINLTYVPRNSRMLVNLTSASTIFLDPNPQDGSRISIVDVGQNFSTFNLTLDGNGRRIDNSLTLVLNTDGSASEWFYRADLGSWTKVTDLSLNDQSPFPSEFDDMLVVMLALRLNPRYGQQTSGESQAMLSRVRTQFKARYSQVTEVRSEEGLIRQASPRSESLGSSLVRFNKGLL